MHHTKTTSRRSNLPELNLDICSESNSSNGASQQNPSECHTTYGEDGDLDSVVLRAIEPPDHSHLSLPDTLREIKLDDRRKKAFKRLLQRVHMNLWTLEFQRDYETAYRAYLYEHAIARVRYAVGIGFVFLVIKTVYEKCNVPVDSTLKSEWQLVFRLHVYTLIPLLLVTLGCTFWRAVDGFCELYGSLPFLAVTYVFTAQKIVLGSKGPIFSMFLVMIPVFGITRFRFRTSVVLVALMFVGHISALFVFHRAETATDILFQGYNYLGGITVGAVCHYRAEILRRRNYAMMLPFCDEPLNSRELSEKLHDPRIKKHVLMSRRTLKFNHPVVEEAFYRHWYLIDACPFEHPNAGELHRTAYRSIRFPVIGVIASQLLLVIQDWEYLHGDKLFPSGAYVVATCLRFAVVIPAYGLAPLFVLISGLRFYREWRARAVNDDRGGLRSPTSRSTTFDFPKSPVRQSEGDCEYSRFVELSTPTTQNKSLVRHPEEPISTPPYRHNYVRFLQWVSAFIVSIHALAMGTILLLVDQLASQYNGSVAPCYFLGFLNALLFPHRSGFRVRFVYATAGSLCVCGVIVASAAILDNPKVQTYATFMALTVILGMMVSHEEESLRRIFFVRKMLRSEEFRRRHDAILTMEPWFKDKIRRWRKSKARQPHSTSSQASAPSPTGVRIPTVNQMAQAGRVGVSLELGRVAFALVVEIA